MGRRRSRSAYLCMGGLLALGLLLLLWTPWSRDDDLAPEPRITNAAGTQPTPSAPTLTGTALRGAPDAEGPPAGEVAAKDPPDATSADASWTLEFEVHGAPSWWRAAFLPTARNGEFEFVSNPPDGPPSGRVEVRGSGQLEVYARGRVPWVSEVLERPASGTLHVTALLEEGLSIAGTLLASDGSTPVHKGQVRVQSALGPDGTPELQLGRSWVHPDVHGRFRISGLSPGPVVVSGFAYDKSQGNSHRLEVEAGDQRVVIRLSPMGVLRVRVSDAATGKAPHTSSIHLDYPSASGERSTTTTSRSMDREPGPPIELKLHGLQLGAPGTLRVHAKGYAFFTTQFELPAEGGVQELAIRLQRGEGGMALLVVTLLVENVARPEVVSVMRYTGKHGLGALETLVSGRLELRLTPGTTSLMIGPAGRESFHVPVELKLDAASTSPGARVEREVRLVHGGQLRFQKRPPGTRVHLSRGTTSIERTLMRRRGTDAVLVLAPGRWSFRIEGRLERWVGEAEIRAGQVTDATWRTERTKR